MEIPAMKPVAPVVDMHVHPVNFMQTTEGMEALLDSMDNGAITRSVVFGCPVKKKWSLDEPDKPTYYLDDHARRYPWPATADLQDLKGQRLSRHCCFIPYLKSL